MHTLATSPNYDRDNPYNVRYMLGLMNSKVLASYFQATLFDGLCVRSDHIGNLPIRRLDFLDLAEECAHDAIALPVARMLALQMQRQAIHPDNFARDLDCQIQQVDQNAPSAYCSCGDRVPLGQVVVVNDNGTARFAKQIECR